MGKAFSASSSATHCANISNRSVKVYLVRFTSDLKATRYYRSVPTSFGSLIWKIRLEVRSCESLCSIWNHAEGEPLWMWILSMLEGTALNISLRFMST